MFVAYIQDLHAVYGGKQAYCQVSMFLVTNTRRVHYKCNHTHLICRLWVFFSSCSIHMYTIPAT